jgi:hypothetical protein
MPVEALYTATFTTPEAWSVERPGAGGERQSFLVAEGRCSGRIAGRLRAANYPRGRPDNMLLPDFRGVLETDDGATVLFAWSGYARPSSSGRELVGSIPRQRRHAVQLAERRRRGGHRRGAPGSNGDAPRSRSRSPRSSGNQ